MADKKELYEVLFEEVNHKMDIVLEGYGEIGRKFEEAREDRQQIKDELTYRIEVVADDLRETKEGLRETRSELRETRETLSGEIKATQSGLEETRETLAADIKATQTELREARKEIGQKIDKIGGIVEDHEIRINTLEKKANVG